jgi:hypothetical protein
MKRFFSAGLVCFLLALLTAAQTDTVRVKLRVILVDKDLNQKPVPFLLVVFRDMEGAKAGTEVKTGLEGAAQAQLRAGHYEVTTPKPAELGGKRYRWRLEVTLSGAEQAIDLTNDNAKAEEGTPELPNAAAENSLTEQFQRLKNSVVTVLSESGHGTGFFVDAKGLVLTNQHVVGNSEFLAVQFDAARKVAARLVAADPQKDVALLWVNMQPFAEATAAPLARSEGGKKTVQEGERVFTIGSPLTLDKILTTGVVSKVEEHTIISDININPGNSGGPLFNVAGQVIGLTTFGQQGRRGPGVSGIVRIEEALPMLAQDPAKLQGDAPSAALLPVEPAAPYPIEGLTETLKAEKYDTTPYYFSAGEFNIAISTPPLDFREAEEKRLKAEREREKRNKKQGNQTQDANATATPRNWEADAGGRKAVLGIYVFPKAKEGFWSGFGRSMVDPRSPANLKFRTDFYRMKLWCGQKEVHPIHPGKIPVVMAMRNAAVNINDSAFFGNYTYLPDAVSPDCGEVRLEIYPAKNTTAPVVKIFSPGTVERIWGDFAAFRKVQATEKKPRERQEP